MENSVDNPLIHDQYTFIHFIDGFFFYMLLNYFYKYSFIKGFLIWFVLHSIYEIKDLYFSYIKPVAPNKIHYYGLISNNSWQNTISDTIYSMLGFILCYLLFNKVKNINSYKYSIYLVSIIFFIVIHTIYYIAYFIK